MKKDIKDYIEAFSEHFNIVIPQGVIDNFVSMSEGNGLVSVKKTAMGPLLTHLKFFQSWYQITKNLDSIVYLGNYFYITAEKLDEKKTITYYIVTKDSGQILAELKWYSPWRKHCFYPYDDTVWDNKCLLEVMNYLNDVNLNRYKDRATIPIKVNIV